MSVRLIQYLHDSCGAITTRPEQGYCSQSKLFLLETLGDCRPVVERERLREGVKKGQKKT